MARVPFFVGMFFSRTTNNKTVTGVFWANPCWNEPSIQVLQVGSSGGYHFADTWHVGFSWNKHGKREVVYLHLPEIP